MAPKPTPAPRLEARRADATPEAVHSRRQRPGIFSKPSVRQSQQSRPLPPPLAVRSGTEPNSAGLATGARKIPGRFSGRCPGCWGSGVNRYWDHGWGGGLRRAGFNNSKGSRLLPPPKSGPQVWPLLFFPKAGAAPRRPPPESDPASGPQSLRAPSSSGPQRRKFRKNQLPRRGRLARQFRWPH